MLKEDDIKLEALRHFQDPMAGGRIGHSDDVLAACESGFERDVGARLLKAGYRLRAQVPAGGYRIDFVVEGADDRRLAVELDGDSFHGPDRWAQDVRRQKALERVGWTFWRCWASEWEANKEATFRDLVAALERYGIAPIGAASSGDTVLVEFRRIRHRAGAEEPPDKVSTAAAATPNSATGDKLAAGTASSTPDRKVRVGDAVVVRYADGKARSLIVQIVADRSADGRGRIAPNSPLAAAILGLRAEDETDVEVAGKRRTVVVEEIREAAPELALFTPAPAPQASAPH
ncbi:MAG: DUF559 domain-containing protein [Pseudomonadota bacterium]|nr:DUF559 domain-containing protein [Pseudomonadota bacterium]